MKGIKSACALLVLTFFSALTQAATAVEMARQAYFLIERDPLDLDQRDEASYLIQRANVLDGDEPWVAVAQSRLTLVSGYKVGQRHDRRAYKESAVSTARQQAERAVRNGPNLAMAHVQLAKATKNLEERDRLYREMIDLDPDYAYAWGNYGSFLLGQKRYREAVQNLERAVELKPYGLAVSQLAEARRKLNQAF